MSTTKIRSHQIAADAIDSSQIIDNTITSADIADGTILDIDISPSANISDTKLSTITTAGKVANSATTATSQNVADSIVARDANGDFVANIIIGVLNGEAATATKLTTARTIELTGDVAGYVSFDGSSNVQIVTSLTGIPLTTVVDGGGAGA